MLDLVATAAFGLEAVVKRECAALGFSGIAVADGQINFVGTVEDIVTANLWLRSADRVLVRISQFTAVTFDELFEGTKALPWSDWIPKNGKFTVLAKSVKSQVGSLSDIQSVAKKAIAEQLKQAHKTETLPETGAEYTVQIALLKNTVTATIDTTGLKAGLHKRGYRARATDAPLKETMAAALVLLSYWKPNRILLDGMCGSGTIPIETALIAKNIAPGLNRGFACENWERIPQKIWREAKKNAYAAINTFVEPLVFGSDISQAAIELAQHNAAEAGVDDCIIFEQKPLEKITLPADYGVTICNPPYGERLGKIDEINTLYKNMGAVFKNPTWSVYVLTSDEFFEQSFGKKANAKRKLFNGNIKVDYYQYHGIRPPKE
ncbi:MAG: class I SAM-dependent RNA methyltransferase [Defluviitaleaceae bacterium]|nr:class I SAM-dependent RNA methyltransferase [Defluviitaleaceae bacterium]